MEGSNYFVRVRRLPKYVSWLFLTLLANTTYLVLAPTDWLTQAGGASLILVGIVGVLVFLALSARELWRTRASAGAA